MKSGIQCWVLYHCRKLYLKFNVIFAAPLHNFNISNINSIFQTNMLELMVNYNGSLYTFYNEVLADIQFQFLSKYLGLIFKNEIGNYLRHLY